MPVSHSFSTTRLELPTIRLLRCPEIKSSSSRHRAVHTIHTESDGSHLYPQPRNIPVNGGAYAPIHMDIRL
jgi:hypothetical protein